MSQYLYSLKVGGSSLTIPAPSIDSFNVFDTGTGEQATAELLWQTYDGSSDIITVDPKTGEITPVGVGTTYVIVSVSNDPLTTGLVKVEVRPSDAVVGATSVAYPQIAAGTDFTVALKADGTVWTWGANAYGQLGNGIYNGTVVYPEKIDSLSNVVKISAAAYTAVALKADGSVWTWGRNNQGQLGNGTTNNTNVPVQVLKGAQNAADTEKVYLENIVAISAGALSDDRAYIVALDGSGVVYGFGANDAKQLTTAGTTYYTVPTVHPAANVVDVKAGRGATTYALTSNGTVYALGRNYSYEYGTGGTSGSVLTMVPLEKRAMAIGAGTMNGMAVTYSLDANSKPQTQAYAWGNNGYFAISTTNNAQIRKPTAMLGRTGVAMIGGGDAVYSVDKDGIVKMSGLGDQGQLANGSNTSTTNLAPYTIFTKNDTTEADNAIGAASAVGGKHSLYIDNDGYVWSTGNNRAGQLALQNAGDSINLAQMIGSEPTITTTTREVLAKKDATTNINDIIEVSGSFNLFTSEDANITFSKEFGIWDETVATIDSDGTITGKGVGQTYASIVIKNNEGEVINTLYVLVSVVPNKDEYITYPMVESGQTHTGLGVIMLQVSLVLATQEVWKQNLSRLCQTLRRLP